MIHKCNGIKTFVTHKELFFKYTKYIKIRLFREAYYSIKIR